MKIGIISDIHGNLAALRAVLAALDAEKCVKILCAGDIVGYGASPLQCIEIVRERRIPCVRGNHDDMMVNPGREHSLRPEVRDAIQWTRAALSAEAVAWLGALPKCLSYAGVEVVHASHVAKPAWHYVLDLQSVMANFLFQTAPVAFNGHTHLPLAALHKRGQKPRLIMLRDMALPPNYRSLINVGSVGQPRDRNPDASCVVFETRDRSIRLCRVAYDIADSQRRIRASGLPARLADRLAEGR